MTKQHVNSLGKANIGSDICKSLTFVLGTSLFSFFILFCFDPHLLSQCHAVDKNSINFFFFNIFLGDFVDLRNSWLLPDLCELTRAAHSTYHQFVNLEVLD